MFTVFILYGKLVHDEKEKSDCFWWFLRDQNLTKQKV